MNDETIITVIIPVYNASSTIDRCVNSILSQTYKELEIVLVNDGSSDDSLMKCNRFAEKDRRIVVVDKPNGGVSSARNMGLKVARGEYCCFVDSDDWIDEQYIEHLSAFHNYDCVVSGYIKESRQGSEKASLRDCSIDLDRLNDDAIKGFFVLGFVHPCWGKLFSMTIIKRNQISFNEWVRISEDSLFCLDYLKGCQSLRIIENADYHYWKDYSQMSLSRKVYTDIFDIYERVFDSVKELLSQKKCDKDLAEAILVETMYPQIYSSIVKIYSFDEMPYFKRIGMLRANLDRGYCRYVLRNMCKYCLSTGEKMVLGVINAKCYIALGVLIKWVRKRK